jgi:putative hemolysin
MSHKYRNFLTRTIGMVLSFIILLSINVSNNPEVNSSTINEGCTSMGNPAYAYCTQIMGYDYQIVTDVDGSQDGMCIMPAGDACPQWDFYAGKCGQAYSYCAQNGLQLETRDDGKDPFSLVYAACIDNQGNDLGTVWSLSGISMISEENNDKFIENLHNFEADPGALPQSRAVPTSFDWRNYAGADWITPVKNQANCGSCWAFSAVGLTEAQHNIMASDPTIDLDLAEQYLVSDCFAHGDCDGGVEVYALEYIRDSGIPDEACYPYIAANSVCSDRCSDYASRLKKVPNANWTNSYTELDIKTLLSSYGPVTLAIGFDPKGAGVYWDGDIRRCTNDIPSGGSDYIDHGVLAVGYNDTGGYWIVKNSWGSNWNGDGYFKLGYNECNVAHSRITWVSPSPPISPTSLTANALSSSQINLSWNDNSTDETSFRVERSPNGLSSWVEVANVSANTTNFSNTGLTSCTTYYYRVRAHRSGDNVYSSYSNLSNATTTGCPLSAPSSLAANAISFTQIDLSWSDNSTDETSFRVERSPNGSSSWVEIANVSANTTSYSNTGLSSCTTYYYRVRAHRSGDNVYSSYSNLSNATTTGCPLTAPSSLATSAISSSQINLSWSDNSTDETSFRIERSPNGSSSWVEIANVSANTTNFSNTGLASCTTYYYRVRAHRSGDNVYSSYSNLSNATTTGCPLTAPSSLATSALSSSQINLSWSDNSTDETSFRVERSPNGSSSWVEIGNVSANTTSYSNTSLSSCTTYYYRVRAHRSGDNVYSSYSNLSSASTTGCPLAAPSSLAASAVSSSQINLSWSDNSTDETSFRVERSPNGTSSWVEVENIPANTTSYSNTGLSSCTTYYYRARAHRSGDNVYSSYSNLSSATTTGCPLAAPSNLLASDGSYTDRVYVSWSSVSGATSYQVFRCTTTSTTSCGAALSSPSSTNYNDYGATAGVTFFYRAKACNSTGCSDYSIADPGFRSQPSVHTIFLPLIVSDGGTTSTILNGGFK